MQPLKLFLIFYASRKTSSSYRINSCRVINHDKVFRSKFLIPMSIKKDMYAPKIQVWCTYWEHAPPFYI